MKYLIIFIFIFSSTLTFAQFNEDNYSFKMKPVKYKDNYRLGRELSKGLSTVLLDKFNLVSQCNIQLSVVINTGKANLIEGMDVQVVGKPEIKFKMKDVVTKEEDIFIYAKDIKSKTTKSFGKELVNSFLSDDKSMLDLMSFIQKFVEEQYKDGCEKQFVNIDKLIKKNDFRNAIRQTLYLIPSSCKTKALELKEELFKKQAVYYCENKIQKAQIMVNSGVVFQMKRSVQILLSIPPDSPCASEALGLSKQLGEKMSKNMEIDLTNYKNLYESDNGSWRSFYIEKIMKDKK